MRLFGLLGAVATALAGCQPAGVREQEISAADYASQGLVWPFTVPRGRIGCEQSFPYFEAGGVRYALNGRARSRWDYVEPLLKVDEQSWNVIRRIDPHGYVPKIDPMDVRDAARALC